MPKPFPLVFTPSFESSVPVTQVEPPANLLKVSRLAHIGLRYITLVRITKSDGKAKRKQIYRIDVKDASVGHTPEFSADIIASTCAAMAIEDATAESKSAYYLATFWGCRPPGARKAPYKFAQFKATPRDEERDDEEDDENEESEGDNDEEENDEENDDEEDEEEEEGEEKDGEGEEEENDPTLRAPMLVGDAGAGEPWNPHARPGDRHELTAPRIEHTLPEQHAAAFPPGAMPPPPTPVQLGAMTTHTHVGMENYAAMMHPAQALFLHHLGGVFAETRASMREMRLDVREARAEAKAATDRMIAQSSMGSAHLEAMHKSTQIGWDAMHHGMTMQLNSLQNSLAWERRIMELQHGQQSGGGAMMWIQMLMALIPQVIAGVAMLKGVPPEAAQMLGSMMGGAMPGAMPAMPPAMPPGPGGFTPPPPPGFAPPSAPPPPGFNGSGPPMGFAPPSAPPPPGFNGHSDPPPGFAPAGAAPPPPGFGGHSGPPSGFAMPPVSPPEPTSFVQFRPSSPETPTAGGSPSSPSMGPGPFGVMPPSGPMGPGPFGVMHEMPPAPMGAVPSVDAMRERFRQAPFCAMIETLLVSTARNGGQSRLIQAGCGHVVHALEVCRGAATDHDAKDRLVELGRLLSTPGVTEAVVQQIVGDEQLMLIDIRDGVSKLVRPPAINHDIANAPGISWPSPSSSMPSPAPAPMRLVHDTPVPTASIVVAPSRAAPASSPPPTEAYVDDDAGVLDDAPARMRRPMRDPKRRQKPAPGRAH